MDEGIKVIVVIALAKRSLCVSTFFVNKYSFWGNLRHRKTTKNIQRRQQHIRLHIDILWEIYIFG